MPLAKNIMAGGFSSGQARSINGTAFNLTITAAGTTQATATALTADINIITTATSGQGVQLYNGVIGDEQTIYNGTLNAIYVYPPTGGNVNQLAANAGFTLASYTGVMVQKVSSTQWIGFLSA
jgi:hypothetical protein